MQSMGLRQGTHYLGEGLGFQGGGRHTDMVLLYSLIDL